MSEDKEKRSIIDTSDCLEAVDVFRGCKNILFVILLVSLLLLQTAFWLVDIGYVKIQENSTEGAAVEKQVSESAPAQAVADQNKPAMIKADGQAKAPANPKIRFEHLSWLIRFLNFLVVPAAVLYCLTLMFGLKISIIGRLGGINHITRAFFLSLLMVILLLPWQRFFWGVVVGAIYTPEDLLNSAAITPANDTLASVLYYMRFTVYWAVVVLLLIFAQIRSGKWARSMLRRLEVM